MKIISYKKRCPECRSVLDAISYASIRDIDKVRYFCIDQGCEVGEVEL